MASPSEPLSAEDPDRLRADLEQKPTAVLARPLRAARLTPDEAALFAESYAARVRAIDRYLGHLATSLPEELPDIRSRARRYLALARAKSAEERP